MDVSGLNNATKELLELDCKLNAQIKTLLDYYNRPFGKKFNDAKNNISKIQERISILHEHLMHHLSLEEKKGV